MSSRGDVFDPDHAAALDNHRVIEIIHRRADMARNQIEQFTDGGRRAGRDLDGKMLLARLQRRQIRTSGNDAGGHARVGRNALVSRIAGHDVRLGMAHDRRHH